MNKVLISEQTLKVFFSTLYMSLDYSDSALEDILTNQKSKVQTRGFDKTVGYILINQSTVSKIISGYIKQLGYEKVNSVYKNFCTNNNIHKKAG